MSNYVAITTDLSPTPKCDYTTSCHQDCRSSLKSAETGAIAQHAALTVGHALPAVSCWGQFAPDLSAAYSALERQLWFCFVCRSRTNGHLKLGHIERSLVRGQLQHAIKLGVDRRCRCSLVLRSTVVSPRQWIVAQAPYGIQHLELLLWLQ